jgi:hypothetical protein
MLGNELIMDLVLATSGTQPTEPTTYKETRADNGSCTWVTQVLPTEPTPHY